MNCTKPDRDVPELVCGHPIPCPYHTVTIDTTDKPPSVKVPVTNPRALKKDVLDTLKEIGRAIAEENEK